MEPSTSLPLLHSIFLSVVLSCCRWAISRLESSGVNKTWPDGGMCEINVTNFIAALTKRQQKQYKHTTTTTMTAITTTFNKLQ